ncbi:MAG: GP88 family protein [Burkholderiaceae bacterium]
MTHAVGRVARRSLPAGASVVESSCIGCGLEVFVKLSADSKTSPGGIWDARKGATATYANALTLPAGHPDMGGSCPGFTEACRGCYAKAIERYDAVSNLARRNLEQLHHVERCAGAVGLRRVFRDVLNHSAGYQLRDGITSPTFRWSAGGDVYSVAMARAIHQAHKARPDVSGWIYTRSLFAVRHLAGLDNLRVFVSADRFNFERATATAKRWGVQIATLADSETEEIVKASHGVICPASGGKWSRDGKPAHVVAPGARPRRDLVRGGETVGACIRCRLCLPGGASRNVVFLRHGGNRDNFPNVPVSIGGGVS